MPVFASRGVTRRPDPPSWETDDVPVVLAGTALWVAAFVVLLVLDLAGAADVPRWWLAMCVCGAALGLVGVRYCRSRQAAVAQAPAATPAPAPATSPSASPAPAVDRVRAVDRAPAPERSTGVPPRP